tara:strand:+ start:9349 stop:9636 length:288 start_codon:yes stop_codon:yes gene_type:complete
MANMKIELLVSTKVGTGNNKRFVMAEEVIEVDEKTAKIMIQNKIAIDPTNKVVEILKDEKLIIQNKSLIEEVKTLKEANELMILEIQELKSESKK